MIIMTAKYDGKTAAEWRKVADDAQYRINHTVNDDKKIIGLGIRRYDTELPVRCHESLLI